MWIPVHGTLASGLRTGRRDERLLEVELETSSVQRRHQDPGQVRRASVRIAFAPQDMAASGQVRRILSGEQSSERSERHRIDRLHDDDSLLSLFVRNPSHRPRAE
jgi:hypothetical protein